MPLGTYCDVSVDEARETYAAVHVEEVLIPIREHVAERGQLMRTVSGAPDLRHGVNRRDARIQIARKMPLRRHVRGSVDVKARLRRRGSLAQPPEHVRLIHAGLEAQPTARPALLGRDALEALRPEHVVEVEHPLVGSAAHAVVAREDQINDLA